MSAPRAILLAAGGTGGHLFPAAALAATLAKRGAEVELATDSGRSNTAAIFPPAPSTPFPRQPRPTPARSSKARAALTLGAGLAAALMKLKPSGRARWSGSAAIRRCRRSSPLGSSRVPSVLRAERGHGPGQPVLEPARQIVACGFPELIGAERQARAKTALPAIPSPLGDRGGRDPLSRLHRPAPEGAGDRRLAGARVMADVVPAALALMSPTSGNGSVSPSRRVARTRPASPRLARA